MIAPEVAIRRATLTHVTVGAIVAVVALVVLLVVGVGPLWAVLGAVAVGTAIASGIYLRQEAIVLRAVKANEVSPGSQPRLENLVEGLCVANGFRRPSIHLIEDPAPNTLIVGRHPRHAALAVTTGLLDRVGRVELEALIAHQLTRMRSRTTQLETTVGVLVGLPLRFAPRLASRLAARLLDPDSSAETDVVSVSLTRYPPGLATALRALGEEQTVPAANPLAFRHLWVDPPPDSIAPSNFSLGERVAVLEEL